VGHASRVTFLVERDVPLPIPELVARPIASARDRRRSWGSSYPSQCCSCPPGFGSSSDPHDPPAVFRTSPRMIFVGGSAVLYTVQIYASPTIVSDSRSRPFAAASGFSKCLRRAIRSGRFPWTEPAVTAVGFVLFQVCRYAISGAAHAILEVSRGPSAAGNPLPAPIRS
jgi:hypothetical protein